MKPDTHYGAPLLGSLRPLLRDRLAFYAELSRTRTPIVRFFLGPLPFYLLNTPAAIREVLLHDVDDFRKGFGNHVLRPLIGNGLFLSEGDAWRVQRKLVQPLFRPDNLERIGAIARASTDDMIERWDSIARSGQPLDVHAQIRELTLRIISVGLCGTDLFERQPTLRDTLANLWQETNARLDAPWRPLLPLPRTLGYHRDLRRMNDAILRAIGERPQQGTDDLVGLLHAARDKEGRALTAIQIRDEVMTFLIAGHECTSIAIAWCIYLLAIHKDIAAELRRQLADQKTAEATKSLLLRPVLHETVRLYPPAWIMARQANRPQKILEFDIPKDAILLVCPWGLHRQAELFPDPERFFPERFAKGNPPDRFAYLPFGAGPRTCVGMGLAMHLAQIILPRLLTRFAFELLRQPVLPEPGLTLRPKGGIWARVCPLVGPATAP